MTIWLLIEWLVYSFYPSKIYIILSISFYPLEQPEKAWSLEFTYKPIELSVLSVDLNFGQE